MIEDFRFFSLRNQKINSSRYLQKIESDGDRLELVWHRIGKVVVQGFLTQTHLVVTRQWMIARLIERDVAIASESEDGGSRGAESGHEQFESLDLVCRIGRRVDGMDLFRGNSERIVDLLLESFTKTDGSCRRSDVLVELKKAQLPPQIDGCLILGKSRIKPFRGSAGRDADQFSRLQMGTQILPQPLGEEPGISLSYGGFSAHRDFTDPVRDAATRQGPEGGA